MKIVRLFLCLFLLLSAGASLAEVDVTIDRNPVRANESFQLVFSLDRNPSKDPDFTVLRQQFQVIGSNRSNSVSIINGQYEHNVNWTIQLMARQAGEFIVPAIAFDNQRTKPFKIIVIPPGKVSGPGNQLLFEVTADKPKVYVQAQVIVTLRLLSATSLSNYQFGEIKIDGLDTVIEPLGDVRSYQTRLGKKNYLALEQQFALFPQQNGSLEIPPIHAEVRLSSRSSFDPFLTGGKIRQIKSDPLTIEVVPVPATAESIFWLPASKVELKEEWSADLAQLVAGEPVTRSLSIIADGLTAAQLPELSLPQVAGIKQYPDQPSLQNQRSKTGIIGLREQKVALIPGTDGVFRLPEVSLFWWNKNSNRLERATLPERQLVVEASVVNPVVGSSGKAVNTTIDAANAGVVSVSRFWIWLSLLLALGWAGSLGFWWWRQRPTVSPPSLSDEPESVRRSRKNLKRACETNDAAVARVALLAWGRAMLAPQSVANLNQLNQLLDAELADQINQLNQVLYASDVEPWDGANLWQACEQLQTQHKLEKKPKHQALAELNP